MVRELHRKDAGNCQYNGLETKLSMSVVFWQVSFSALAFSAVNPSRARSLRLIRWATSQEIFHVEHTLGS